MPQITQLQLPSGATLFVEADDRIEVTGEQRVAIESLGTLINNAEQKTPDFSARVSPVVEALKVVREKLAEIGHPDSVELGASIKFTGEAGVILSKYGAEASISVKLKWGKAADGKDTGEEDK
jgi:hypothetical protein